jgi:hypothetical protein
VRNEHHHLAVVETPAITQIFRTLLGEIEASKRWGSALLATVGTIKRNAEASQLSDSEVPGSMCENETVFDDILHGEDEKQK